MIQAVSKIVLALITSTLVVAHSQAEAEQAACLNCHTPTADVAVHAVFNTAHGTLGGGSEGSCIACHGDSQAHQAKPTEEAPTVSFGPHWPASAEDRNAMCLNCHEQGGTTLWHGSEHEQQDLACDSCHDTHTQRDPALAPEAAMEQCLSCHPRTRAELQLPSRHPILEGKTGCTDCHNPHGSMSEGMLKELSINDNCNSCHQEKRGPFLWEHTPVSEDCTVCHRPHGSVNPRLLTARGPALCQQCHAVAFHPSVPYGGEGVASGSANRNLLGKNCLNCHNQVHGSNHPLRGTVNPMNRQPRLVSACAVACSLAAPGTLIAQPSEDPFAPLMRESRPLNTRLDTDYSGAVQLGLGYVSDPNFMFGQYNGLNEEGASLIGKLNWSNIGDADSYWQISGDDLGLDTREGSVTWGKVDRVKVVLGFDSQLQVRNNSGATPFRGTSQLQLPTDWISGPTTSDWTNLDQTLNGFDRELERNRYSVDVTARLNDNWQFLTRLDYEDKQGTGDIGAAVFNDASVGDAVLLPADVDYSTTELDLALIYQGDRLNLDGHLFYSDFNNREELLSWQNPYSSFGPNVRYPDGVAAAGLAPDNQRSSGRLSGHYLIAPRARLQFDGSYSITSQDQDFADYTINPLLTADVPVPLDSLDAEVATGIANVRFILRPLPKLNLELRYKGMDKDYDAPREGYQYVPGDGGDQSRPALTVYNTRHDYSSQTFGIEAAYRLPLHSKLRLEYDYETIHRENTAVDKTQESRFVAAYRIQPWQSFSTNIELHFGDRAASAYEWAQSYYALLDTELINATPDKQRYQNHPSMSQFYLANREYMEGRLDFTFAPGVDWQPNLNLQLREDDYDKTELGLDDTSWQRLHFSASYRATDDLQLSFYGGYDQYEANQTSRAFRGGQEKNAFEVTPPLPQASDPTRNWDIDTDDASATLGANINWLIVDNIELGLDYSFVDTRSEQGMKAYGGTGLAPSDLPAVNTVLHHLQASGTWHLRDSLSIKLDYQYYRYSTDDWAWQGLGANTIDQVLSFGERNPNEQIHYVGTSVIYRWQ